MIVVGAFKKKTPDTQRVIYPTNTLTPMPYLSTKVVANLPLYFTGKSIRRRVYEFGFPMCWLTQLMIPYIHSNSSLPKPTGKCAHMGASYVSYPSYGGTLRKQKKARALSPIPTYGPLKLNVFWRFDTLQNNK